MNFFLYIFSTLHTRLQKYKDIDKLHQAVFYKSNFMPLCKLRDHQTGIIKDIQIEIIDKDIKDFSTLFLGKRINDILHHHSANFHLGANQIIALGAIVPHSDAALLQHLCQLLEIQQHRAPAYAKRINEITQ